MDKGTLVDAIEDGRIVRVTKEYALREGLMILREIKEENPVSPFLPSPQKQKRTFSNFDPFRKPLKKNEIMESLKDQFHWLISEKRRERNMTRKQLAEALNETEYNIKMIENGILPSNDFILISKIEKFFGINLRKNPNESASVQVQRQRYDQKLREKFNQENKKEEKRQDFSKEEIEVF